MKKKYYLTFCRKHQHRDSYVIIIASDYSSAFNLSCAKFGLSFQRVTEASNFNKDKYPGGLIETIEGA
ncbi:hypothetical protein CMK18_22335 [Candidatus Poribacteria bacterium]|nr:hypothetical protein [Candidatus Poribacteria bacterium]